MTQIISFLESFQPLLEIICICIFLSRLKYVREYGLSLWGTFLLLELIFMLLALIIPILLYVSFNSTIMIFTNILMIFRMGFTLMLIRRFGAVQSKILIVIFGIFIGIWFIEFSNQGIKENVILYYAEIFSKVSIVCLSWFYLLGTFKKMSNIYQETPFLLVTVGWLLYCISFITFNNPELIKLVDALWVKEILLIATGITNSIAVILYTIAFWKTKEWSLKTQQ